jgi:hypothetical protein
MQPSLVDKAIARILELSANLQIKRRTTAPGSPSFLNYGAAIAAYGQVLGVLTALQVEEEYCSELALLGSLPSSRVPRVAI